MDTGDGLPLDADWLDSFTIVRLRGTLTAGSVGPIYIGEHTGLKRDVAVKVFAPEMAAKRPEFVAAWEELARRVVPVHHRNLARIHEVPLVRSAHCVVAELLAGAFDLRPRVRDDAIRIATEAACGLAAAHAAGITCWRWAPDILLDPDGHVKVDVKLSNASAPALPTAVAVYTPPEECMGGPAARPGDVWMLGTLLFSMLAGEPPFPGTTAAERLTGIVKEPLPDLPAGVPDHVVEAIRSATRKDPRERCSAEEFAAAL